MSSKKYIRNSIFTRLIFVLVGISCITNFTITLFIQRVTYNRFIAEVEDKGISIGRNLASNAIEPLLIEDFVKLRRMISAIKDLERDVYYIYILDNENNPLIHTFSNFFPKGLAETNFVTGSSHRIQIISTESGIIRDIGYPVFNGLLGSIHIGISEKRVQATVSSLVRRVTGILLFITLLGIVFIYFLSKKTMGPLNHILNAIRKVGEGDFNQKVEIKTENELGLLARTFNDMTERLENIKQELDRAQKKLLQTAKMATVGQFSVGIAHEINNPLAGVSNCIRTLLANPEIKSHNRGYLELSLKGLIRIENIIRQILGVSDEILFEPKLLNINLVLEESLSLSSPKLNEKKIELETKFEERPPQISGDGQLLQQVFLNIINNAVDAMEKGGMLTVIAQTISGKKEIEVKFTDNGKGIKSQDIDKVYDPFFTTKEVGKGVGLGMYLSYNYIQRHNGTINMDSTYGKGTTVTITLPVEFHAGLHQKE